MLKPFYRYMIVFVVIVIFAISFTSTHNVQSIDDLAYAVAIGIDIEDNDNLKVTFQFNIPTASGENSSSETAPTIVDSVEAVSIDSAIHLMNTFISKEINLAHCKVIVFSEEIAKRGIEQEVNTLINNVQIRPDVNIIISTCPAQEYIQNVSPSLENLVAKFYETLPRSAEYTGYTANVDLVNFFNKAIDNTAEPVAILGNSISKSSNEEKEQEKENRSTFEVEGGIENIGLAVFKEYKMVGKLNATETLSYLMINNQVKSYNISVPIPQDEGQILDLYCTLDNKPKIQVLIVNGSPYVRISMKVNARISSINSVEESNSLEHLKEIGASAAYYLKEQIESYLYRTAKEFHSDISGLGSYSLKGFKTHKDFDNYHWTENYQDTFFDVNVDVTIRSSFLLTGT